VTWMLTSGWLRIWSLPASGGRCSRRFIAACREWVSGP